LAAPKASAKLDELERALAQHQWVGGNAPTAADQEALEAIKDNLPTPEMYPNVFYWYSMASKFDAKLRAKWTGGPAVAPAQQAAAKEETADDDDLDLFGSDDEEEKAQMERMKKAAAAAGKDKKKAVIAKSLIVWEVKPWGEETDLDELAKMILAIKVDGLEWKTEYKKEPIAYGVFKIVIGAVVEDDKVSTDDVAETIEAFEDHVQSVDIAAFNKL
jgi:elongation factor 1-beta